MLNSRRGGVFRARPAVPSVATCCWVGDGRGGGLGDTSPDGRFAMYRCGLEHEVDGRA